MNPNSPPDQDLLPLWFRSGGMNIWTTSEKDSQTSTDCNSEAMDTRLIVCWIFRCDSTGFSTLPQENRESTQVDSFVGRHQSTSSLTLIVPLAGCLM